MKRFAMGLAVAAAVAGAAQAAGPGPALLARGDYLVNRVVGCNDCHSPMDRMGRPIPGKELTGATLPFGPVVPIPGWNPTSPRIRGMPAGYTEAQLAHFLETGRQPNGSFARPPMPAFRLTAEDARAVTAYLHSMR